MVNKLKLQINQPLSVSKNTCCHGFNIGQIVYFSGLDGDNDIKCEDNKEYWWMNPEDLTPICDEHE